MIMASDGLWDELSHKDATDIVQKVISEHGEVGNNSTDALRHKISKRLLEKALESAAKDRGIEVDAMLQIPLGKRRSYHDDITIAVVDLTN